MHNSVIIEPLLDIPTIKACDDLASLLVAVIRKNDVKLANEDILCVASKVISIAENRFVKLATVIPTDEAARLHEGIQRKDPRVLQLILNEANNDMANLRVTGDWIGARTKHGRILTSAGIDKVDEDAVLLLPADPDESAKRIALAIQKAFGVQIGVLVTDSDGREGIAGATQLCVGTYGVAPIRKQNGTEETICDMLAASAGLVMGQRGVGIPVAIIRGFEFEFAEAAKLADAY